mgnify:CR=1 FL=1
MKKRIRFLTFVISAITISIMAVFGINQTVNTVKNQAFDDLISVEQLVENYGIENISNNTNISEISQSIRVSWISIDGTVLYDSAKDTELLDNHLKRPEIIDAINNGTGQAIRESLSLNKNTYYFAKLLDDETLIRISKDYDDISIIIKKTIYFMLFLASLLIGISYLFAKKISLMLIEPIKELSENIEVIEYSEKIYEEIQPFVKKIREQHLDIIKSSKLRQEFTANVTHELKTPLTVIAGYSELMSNEMVDVNDCKFIGNEIYDNSKKLQLLIDDILILSHLDQNNIGFENSNINLDLVIKKIISNFRLVARKKNIDFHYEGNTVFMNTNYKLMEELMSNLISNAIKYNKQNGSVFIKLSKNINEVIIEIRDTGMGISKKDQKRIFERFYRVENNSSKLEPGNGLGLSIVKHIVAQYDGEIEVSSEINKGTNFKIIF